jgi:hypothetical protein
MLGKEGLPPRDALARLKALDAPVAPIEMMLEESVAGRYT